jgi:hypothetical protein
VLEKRQFERIARKPNLENVNEGKKECGRDKIVSLLRLGARRES